MSTAAIDAEPAEPAEQTVPAAGKKKLVIVVVAALLLLAIAAGGTLLWMKKRAAAAAAEDGGAALAHVEERQHIDVEPPTFVPLDPFTVNLADRDTERYAQVGMTLEIDDPKFAGQIKLFMPAIRNNILMVLAHKTSAELLEREGKLQLATEVAREVVRPMGIESAAAHNPVRRVHFSNFIIQ